MKKFTILSIAVLALALLFVLQMLGVDVADAARYWGAQAAAEFARYWG